MKQKKVTADMIQNWTPSERQKKHGYHMYANRVFQEGLALEQAGDKQAADQRFAKVKAYCQLREINYPPVGLSVGKFPDVTTTLTLGTAGGSPGPTEAGQGAPGRGVAAPAVPTVYIPDPEPVPFIPTHTQIAHDAIHSLRDPDIQAGDGFAAAEAVLNAARALPKPATPVEAAPSAPVPVVEPEPPQEPEVAIPPLKAGEITTARVVVAADGSAKVVRTAKFWGLVPNPRLAMVKFVDGAKETVSMWRTRTDYRTNEPLDVILERGIPGKTAIYEEVRRPV